MWSSFEKIIVLETTGEEIVNYQNYQQENVADRSILRFTVSEITK